MKLRVQGVEPREIAVQLGVTRKQIMADLRKVSRDNDAEAGVWNAVLVARNEQIWRKLEKQVEKGDLWAIDRAFQCIDRQITLTNADKVASDATSEVDKWLTAASGADEDDFEDMEAEILETAVVEYDDLSPDDLDEELDTVT